VRIRRLLAARHLGPFVVCLCAGGVGLAAPPSAKPTPVIAAAVRMLPFEDRIEALGTLKANESVELTASVTETVTLLQFDDGDRVERDTTLAEMTSAEEHALLEEAEALVAEAERQYRRVQSLARQGTAAKSLLDERQREWQTARARLVAIESRLSDRLIKAPFSGVVGLRNISVGALVEPGDVITTLDDDSVMKLDLAIPSVFLADLMPGMPIEARSRVYPGRSFDGRVQTVDSRVDPVTRSVIVRALLPNPGRLLKPGMLMQVTLRKNVRETLVIPEAALMPLGREQFVLVAEPADGGHKAAKRRVVIGSRRPGEVEVLEGLSEGEFVVTHGTQRVRPGQAVVLQAVEEGTEPLEQLLQQRGEPAR
jgi:membrane fusion protein (multidrug efflux system)